MYLASVDRRATPARSRTTKVAGNVLALGAVSLVTDVSSEMVTAVLPLYLVAGLGLGPAVYGLVDGLYTGATALLRLAGGYVADRVRRRKLVAGLGYAVSAVAKAGLLLAGGSLAGIGAAIVADRAGKGLRTAVSLGQAAALLRRRPVRFLLLGAVLLGLSTIGDGFVYLLLQRRENLAAGWFPLLAVGTSLAYLLLAVPLGVLADRLGRTRVFLGGYAALLVVYVLLATSRGGLAALVTVLLLYGVFYAATDGVLMAVAGPVLPAELRTTGIALI
ncbi:MFS transporter [Actinoplanes sp. NPDC049316]|uniref:MFS transporter n=1 Tax=Actinoplanes sp. NPDC049316 TaxID=3154727 RepID=UPI0034427AA5